MKPYVYQHYPLWITLTDGSQVLVNDADHEAAVLGAVKDPYTEGDSRMTLREQAQALGIEVDGRWSAARLQREIAERANFDFQETHK